jgi:hypothetical protein
MANGARSIRGRPSDWALAATPTLSRLSLATLSQHRQPRRQPLFFLGAAITIYWTAINHACQTHHRRASHNAEVTDFKSFSRVAALLSRAAVGAGTVLWMLCPPP